MFRVWYLHCYIYSSMSVMIWILSRIFYFIFDVIYFYVVLCILFIYIFFNLSIHSFNLIDLFIFLIFFIYSSSFNLYLFMHSYISIFLSSFHLSISFIYASIKVFIYFLIILNLLNVLMNISSLSVCVCGGGGRDFMCFHLPFKKVFF